MIQYASVDVLIPPLRISFRPLRYFLPRHGAACAVPYSEKQYRSGPADAGSAAVFRCELCVRFRATISVIFGIYVVELSWAFRHIIY